MSKIAVITTYFNSVGYKSLLNNYHRFSKNLITNYDVDLFVVELLYPGQTQQLQSADRIKVIPARSKSRLWHKERLINLAIEQLDPSYSIVAWIDADILFTNPNLVEHIKEALEKYEIIQLFEQINYADPQGVFYQTNYGFGFSYVNGYMHRLGQEADYSASFSHPGFAWAAKSSLLKQANGVYYGHCVGGADYEIALSSIGAKHADWYSKFNERFRNHLLEWNEKFYDLTKGKLGYVPGNIIHLQHGKNESRAYSDRVKHLVLHDYFPPEDIKIGPEGTLEWASDKPEMHKGIAEYFIQRNEDFNPNSYYTRMQDKWPIILNPTGGPEKLAKTLEGLTSQTVKNFVVHIECFDYLQMRAAKKAVYGKDYGFQVKFHDKILGERREEQLAAKILTDSHMKKVFVINTNTELTPDFLAKKLQEKPQIIQIL